MDDNFVEAVADPGNHEFTLKERDFYLYIAGMLVRIQTIVLGFILFGVEKQNICIVPYPSMRPLPYALIPENLNLIPGGFANMSQIFETILWMLFITSVCTSVMYIVKVVHVIRYHRSTR